MPHSCQSPGFTPRFCQTASVQKSQVQHQKKQLASRFSVLAFQLVALLMPIASFLLFFTLVSKGYSQVLPSLHSRHIFLDAAFPGQVEPVKLVRKILVSRTEKKDTPLFTYPMGKTPEHWGDKPFVMTTYFTSRADPQRGYPVGTSFSYIQQWYQSLQKLGMRGIVFTDSAYQSKLQGFSTENIIFVQVKIDGYRSKSLNDIRFFVYRDFLQSLKQKPAMVFMTDGSDVEVVQNPFSSFIKDKTLYLGQDGARENLDTYFWMRNQYKTMTKNYERNSTGVFAWADMEGRDVVNAGVIGGETSVVVELLDRMTKLMDMFNPNVDINMGVLNVVAWRHFQGRMVYGDPVSSKFKGFESWRSNVYFRHKR